MNLVGIAEKRDLSDYSSPKRCTFVANNKNGVSNTYRFQNQNYDFSANPAVSVSPRTGDGYAVCMSVKKDYSRGQLDLFRYDAKTNEWSRVSTPILNTNGIPDKPVIVISEDGTALLAYLDISKNKSRLNSKLKIFQISAHGQLLKEFGVDATKGVETSFGIDGQQGIDIVYDAKRKRFIISYGTYGGKELNICVLDLEQKACKKQSTIRNATLEVPITRLAVSQRGEIGITSYDAHRFGDGAAYLLDGESLEIVSEKTFKNATLVTPFFKDDEFNYFYLQQNGQGLNLRISDTCNIPMGSEFGNNDYLGAYAASLNEKNELTLLVPTTQKNFKTVNSDACKLSTSLQNIPTSAVRGIQ